MNPKRVERHADNNVKLDDDHHRTLKTLAAVRGVTMREIIEDLIDQEAEAEGLTLPPKKAQARTNA